MVEEEFFNDKMSPSEIYEVLTSINLLLTVEDETVLSENELFCDLDPLEYDRRYKNVMNVINSKLN